MPTPMPTPMPTFPMPTVGDGSRLLQTPTPIPI